MSIETQALEKAIAFLKAIGAQYKIQHGDFLVDTFPPVKPKRHIVNDWVKITNYIEKIKALQPGELLEFKSTDYKEFEAKGWNSFASSMSAYFTRHLGQDDYIFDNENGVAKLLRVN